MGRHDQQQGAVLSPGAGRKSKNESFQDHLSSITGQNLNERTKPSSFQDPKHQKEHTNGKNNQHQSKSSSFQDHLPPQHPQK